MSGSLIQLDVILDEVTQRALFGFLARYHGDTLRAYRQDLKAYLRWCGQHDLQPMRAERPHLELYLRWMEQRAYAPATIGRRFATVAGFYRYEVIDGHLPADPSVAVTRPAVPWEGQRRTVLHPLEFAALLTAARRDGPQSHALIALLGMIGLRVSEVCRIDVTDLPQQSGYELISILGKGRKPAVIPLPIPVLRSVREAAGERAHGPLLLNRHGERFRPPQRCRPAQAPGDDRGADHGGEPAQPAPDVLHRGAHRGRAAAEHAVRHAARRRPHHHPLRHGPGEPGPARRARRRRVPRRHGHRVRRRGQTP